MKHNLAQDLEQCALPSALEMMGERWSFLILRGALSGIRHFEEFQSTLGIARNILANRLARLVENGILVRQPMQCDRRKVEYRLTPKGQDLAPAMVALRQWGERWGCGTQAWRGAAAECQRPEDRAGARTSTSRRGRRGRGGPRTCAGVGGIW